MAREKASKKTVAEREDSWIRVSHKELVDALAAMKRCVSVEHSLPPTQVAVLDEGPGTIRCSNLEVGMCLFLASMNRGTTSIMVPRDELLKLLRASAPKGDMRFSPVLLRQKDRESLAPLVEVVDVDGDRCELEAPCAPDDMPVGPVFDPATNVDGPKIEQWAIENEPLETLKWLRLAVGHDEDRTNLMQVRLGDDSKAVATDGHRMHLAMLPEHSGNGSNIGIPSCALAAVEAMAKWFDESVVRVQKQGDDGGGFARGIGSSWTVAWGHCEKQYPEWNKVVPPLINHIMFDDTPRLRRALTKLVKSGAAIHGGAKDATVKLSMDGGEFVLESAGDKHMRIVLGGTLTDEKGGDGYIGFAPRYMLEALEVFGDGPVRMQFEDAASVIRIDSADNDRRKSVEYTAIVMPKRL